MLGYVPRSWVLIDWCLVARGTTVVSEYHSMHTNQHNAIYSIPLHVSDLDPIGWSLEMWELSGILPPRDSLVGVEMVVWWNSEGAQEESQAQRSLSQSIRLTVFKAEEPMGKEPFRSFLKFSAKLYQLVDTVLRWHTILFQMLNVNGCLTNWLTSFGSVFGSVVTADL